MGPTLIFDKSLLQSLHLDEAVWLDQFYICNITPLFYIETLADLEKEVQAGRTPEQVVGSLAAKTPDLHSAPNVHHLALLAGELGSGHSIDVGDGRPLISGGRPVELEGQKGVVFAPTPEQEAFNRWQSGRFLELERRHAKAWRDELSLIDLDQLARLFQPWVKGRPRLRTLDDAKALAETILDGEDYEAALLLGLNIEGVPEFRQREVLERWRASSSPRISVFAPYFRYVVGVDLFFYLALASDVVSRRRTNRADLAYLYYLPFCKIFTSSDNFHADVVPLFLRPDQSFIPGAQLKADLRRLDERYAGLPEADRQRGLYYFASSPPTDGDFLVAQLWDKYLPGWRAHATAAHSPQDDPKSPELIEYVKRQMAAPTAAEPAADPDQADYLGMTRRVSLEKGKWWRFPPEVQADAD